MAKQPHWTDFYDPDRDAEHYRQLREMQDDGSGGRPDACARQHQTRPQKDGDKWCHRCWRGVAPRHKCDDGIFEPHVTLRKKVEKNGKEWWRFERRDI